MSHGDPRPKASQQFATRPWPFTSIRVVEFVHQQPWQSDTKFGDVLTGRRSSRAITAAATPAVASIVRETLSKRFLAAERAQKVVLSAGALHPLRCVFLRSVSDVMVYDDDNDLFMHVAAFDEEALRGFINDCRAVLPDCDGHWLLLIADRGKTAQAYDNPESLLWRDAGAVLQAMALICEAAGLAFCPLGLLGQQGVDALLQDQSNFLAVGVAAVGRKG
ncbi:hypothetical protein [Neorhizobium sp. DAR64872/K0K18]|uniref:hypothetical protein n=1 Tax=Neorhizobium sp. DAR64872/K0K18 TaxID=3421958 RepID=UPI003D29229F